MRLRRADCSGPGLRRVRRGRGFSYLDAAGHPLTDAPTLARINALAIPPAWREVWICPDERGHLQATGLDAAGRKQYLYHELWREFSATAASSTIWSASPTRCRDCGPRSHRALGATDAPTRERVAAGAVRLLDIGLFRVGSEQYADDRDRRFRAGHPDPRASALARPACRLRLPRQERCRAHPRDLRSRQRRAAAATVAPAGWSAGAAQLPDGRRWCSLGSDGVNEHIKATAGRGLQCQGLPHLERHGVRRRSPGPLRAASACRGRARASG